MDTDKPNCSATVLLLLCGLASLLWMVDAQANGAAARAAARPRIAALHDPGGTLTRAEAASPAWASRFHAVSGTFHPGFTDGAWWLRLTFPASGKAHGMSHQDWRWLHVLAPWMEQLDAWLPEAHGGHVSWRRVQLGAGFALPKRSRAVGAGVAVPLVSPPAGPVTVWLRLSGQRALWLQQVDLWSDEAMAHARTHDTAVFSIVLAAVVLLMILTLIRAVASRHFAYLALSLLLGTVVVLVLGSWHSFLAWFAGGDVSRALAWLDYGCVALLFAPLLTAYTLLDVQRLAPRVARVLGWITAASLLAVIPAALGASRVLSVLVVAELLCAGPLFLALAAVCVWRREPLAGWLLATCLIGGGAATLFAMHYLGWVDLGRVGRGVLLAAPITCVVLVAVLLAARGRRRAVAAHASLKQAAEVARQSATRLEVRVAERTAELNAALEDQSNLLLMISHEFRTPLAIIDAAVQFVEDGRQPLAAPGGTGAVAHPDAADPAALADSSELRKIRRATRRLAALVDSLLVDDRMDRDIRHLHLTPAELGTLVREACQRRTQISDRIYNFASSNAGPEVLADPVLLGIVIDNLLDNATKYSPASSVVDVFVARKGEEAVLRVRDHGNGIREQDLPHVFDRYWRAPTAVKRPGLGFGLYVARRIVQRHGGSLSADNAPGGGAVFELRLPAQGQTGLRAALVRAAVSIGRRVIAVQQAAG